MINDVVMIHNLFHMPPLLLPSLSPSPPPIPLPHSELLHNLFHILYDLELVDEAAFLEWRDRGKEGFGKGNAVHSLYIPSVYEKSK